MTELLKNRHLAAVMFTDMAGYTALMQQDEAAALRSRQRHRNALDRALDGRSGEVLQYFGDGSLAVFSSSVQAVEAAIDIQRNLGGDPALRIGLHAGDIAYDTQGAYGDAVNIAARLEAICPPGGVTISQKIYDDIRRHPNLPAVPSGNVRLKNISESVPTYAVAVEGLEVPSELPDEEVEEDLSGPGVPKQLARRLDELTRRAGDPLQRITTVPGRVPLVGRRTEVTVLRQVLETAESGAGAAVFIRGPRGVGKTRLAQEATQHARARGWSVLAGRAHPSERLVPYAPFSDALMPLLQGLDMDEIARLTPGSDAALCALFPALGQAPRISDVSLAGPGESRTRLYWQFASMLSTLASHRPLLIVLEDLDFADRASLELFEFVARQSRADRIVYVVEYTGADPDRLKSLRELEQSLVANGTGRVLELEPLGESEAVEFIREALELEAREARELGRTLYGWSRGNPFFMTGTLRGLVESGALRRVDGRWKSDRLDALQLPHTVRDAVLVWMGQLDPSTLEVARTMAVIGREVDYELIQFVTGMGHDVVSRALDELVRHQLLVESESQWTLRYAFRNPIIHEVLRDELALGRRRELHTRIAETLEGYYGPKAEEHADELAYHFGRAHPGTAGWKSIRYLTLAGEAALERHASREAAEYLQEALDRSEASPPGVRVEPGSESIAPHRIVRGLARARRRLGEIDASVALWHRLLAGARDAGPGDVATIHRQIGLTYMAGGKLEEAIEALAAATEWASAGGQVPLIIRSQLAQAQCFQAAGRPAEAEEAVDTSLMLAQEFGRPGLLAQVYRSMTQLKIWTGHVTEAREAAQKAMDLAETTGNRGVAFWSRWARATLEGLIGDTENMERYLKQAAQIADQVGSPLFELAVAELQIELHYARGEWDEGIELGYRSIELARSTDGRLILPRLLVWMSLIHLGRGELDVAEELTRESWEVSGAARAEDATHIVDLHAVVPAHIGRASCAMARGDWTEATRIAEAALRIADRSGYTVWAIHYVIPIIGEAAIHARDLGKAAQMSSRMREEAERLNHPLGLAWAAVADAILVWLQGDSRAGAKAIRESAEAMEAIPMTFEAARLRRQLAGRLAEIGKRDEALEELHRVQRTLHKLKARPELEKAEGQFRELGVEVPKLD